MKRSSRQLKSKPMKVEPQADIHLHLCHRCFHLNESSMVITKCSKCERPFSDVVSKVAAGVSIGKDSPEALDESDIIFEVLGEFDNAADGEDTILSIAQTQAQIENAEEAAADDEEEAASAKGLGVNGLAVRW